MTVVAYGFEAGGHRGSFALPAKGIRDPALSTATRPHPKPVGSGGGRRSNGSSAAVGRAERHPVDLPGRARLSDSLVNDVSSVAGGWAGGRMAISPTGRTGAWCR